jgi:DNA-binding transcriptional LysR family regulator
VTIREVIDYTCVVERVPARVFASVTLDTPLVSIDPITGDVIPHVAMTSVASARAIVKRTDGVGITAPSQVAEDVRQGTLAILDLHMSELRSGYGVTWLRSRELSPAARAFVATLKEIEAELAAGSASKCVSVPAGRRRRSPRRR